MYRLAQIGKVRRIKGKGLKPQQRINTWKIVKGDQVQVIYGHKKGEKGKVLKVLRKKNRVVVEGVNVTRRHNRGGFTKEKQVEGYWYAESPIHYSNVSLIDPTDEKPCRISYKYTEEGKKVRVSRRTGTVIDKPLPPPSEKKEAGPKDTLSEVVLRRTFDEETLNPLKMACYEHRLREFNTAD
eukprot:TRINITY_DN11251_c0_g1_i1.p1 TRINITY_DN11251_c0_g1~~TRINITY_DN11251_c0_g1_i1.p1  ORF type:complete len:183 (-),score=39.08 TRINITY_DN11251_c0_g1_i1:21-569(-)